MRRERRRTVWWDRPLRVLQFNFEDRLGLYVPRISGRDVAEAASEVGANVVVVFARDAWGYTYYRGSSVGPPRPGMPGDFLRELLEEARKRGLKVVVMVAHTANKLLYLKHSDWGQVNYRGEPVLLEHAPEAGSWEPEWPQMCPNSPFLDHAIREVEEAVELGVDGVLFDSFRYQPDPEKACYCRWCRERFQRETGEDMPVKADWSNSLWRKLWDWRYRVVVEALKRLSRTAKKRGEGVMVLYNSHPAGWAGRANRVVELARGLFDGVFAECSEADFQPPGFLAEMVKLTRAMAGAGVKVFASRNAFHQLKPTQPAPPALIRQGLREIIAAGGEPWVLVFSSQFMLDKSWRDAVRRVFEEHKKLEEYMEDSEPVKHIAITVSNTTRDHYGRLRPDMYNDEVRGFYYALTALHYPVTYILDGDIVGGVNGYKLLVLADTACIDLMLAERIRGFAGSGGALLATFNTGFYNGDCTPWGGNVLSDLLGFTPAGETWGLEWAYVCKSTTHPITEGLPDCILIGDTRRNMRESLNLASFNPVEPIEDSEAPLTLKPPAYRYGHEYTLGRSSPPPHPHTAGPALVLASNGRTAYYPWRLGLNYWYTGSPQLLRLIGNTVELLAGPPPLQVVAPRTLIAEYWRQGERIIVHMINYTGPQRIPAAAFTGGRQPLPPYSGGPPLHPLDEIVPVAGVRLRVRADFIGTDMVKAYSPITNRKFLCTTKGGWVEVSVGIVDEYEVLIVEPARG